MAYKIIKDGGGESDPLVNKMMTTDEVKLLIRQIIGESTDFEMEPVEVVDFADDGSITGRYVVSEHDKSINELNNFIPLGQNVIQYPVAGEVVIGVEFFGKKYYFSDINPLVERINSQQFNISNTTTPDTFPNVSNFIDEEKARANITEGDTILQGRFDNSITLTSNQPTLNSPTIDIQNGSGQVLMTQNQKVFYSEPTNTLSTEVGIDKDYDKPQIVFDSDRIMINAKSDDIGIFAQGKVSIKGNSVNIENDEQVKIVTQQMVTDYTDGVKEDFNQPVDGDTRLLPKQSIELAKMMKPIIDSFKAEIQALAYLILPPSLPSGAPNPSFMKGMKIKFDNIKNMKEAIDKFTNLDFLPRYDFETISVNEFFKELGLNNLSIDFPTDDWNTFFDDIEGTRQKIQDAQDNVANTKASIVTLNTTLNAIRGGGSTEEVTTDDVLKALDTYEADPNSSPVDTTDLRAVIADGADVEDLKDYFENGGSPQLDDLLGNAEKAEQEAQQLNQILKIIELSKPA
jgi:hypothetical protein